MGSGLGDLISYRLERAREMLLASEQNLDSKQYGTLLNRSYYAVFHAMRAANLLDGFDSSKHSGVIAHFNSSFLKQGKMDKHLSKIIKDTSYLRQKSDYEDFYLASKQESESQLANAKKFVSSVEEYLRHKMLI